MSELLVKVVRKIPLVEGICSFEFAAADAGLLPPFSAGSHIDVYLPGGMVRQYSLCNHPSEQDRYLIAVLREASSRGGSIAMHDRIKVGDVVRIGEPKNHFPLVPAPRSLLFAGGIGITPLLCMAERLAQTESTFELHYCARSQSRMAFADRLKAAPFARMVHMHVDDGPEDQKLHAEELLAKVAADTHIYVCGPTGFMTYIIATARQKGWPEQNIHREYFTAAPIDGSADEPFDIKIASTGRIVHVPIGQRATEALAQAGVDIPMSCEQGVCGTCITRVLEGQIDHRDLYLNEEERARNDQFTPCVSRARSKLLVLDL